MSEIDRSWLNDLMSPCTPTSTQFDAARSHRASIESRLDAAIGIYRMFEIGSLRHRTSIWEYGNADYLVSLKGDKTTSPWTMLTRDNEALQQRFPGTSIVIRQPAVVCNFSDRVVETVPGYISDSGYRIANPASDWMKRHREGHDNYVNTINSKHSGGVKTLARQLKIWNYLRNIPVSSCYLEMRATKYLDGELARRSRLCLPNTRAQFRATTRGSVAVSRDRWASGPGFYG